jgi:hypothetical protein
MNMSKRIGIYNWDPDEGFGKAIFASLVDLGFSPRNILDKDFSELETISMLLIYGPWGSLEPVMAQLRNLASNKKPVTVLWQSEQFPDPRLPGMIWRVTGLARSYLETFGHRSTEEGLVIQRPGWDRVLSKLHRHRYFGDVYRYSKNGLLDKVAVWSKWTADLLNRRGVPAITAYMGHYPACGRDLELERDIPVLWLGKPGSGRRHKILERIRERLHELGIEMKNVDGVEHPYVFGQDRTELLNRSKLVLNLLRKPWDNTSMRFFLAAANKTAIVSEPMYAHIPFKQGVHYIQGDVDQLPDLIKQWLQKDTERKQMTECAYELGVKKITMKGSLEKIIRSTAESGDVQ